MPVIVLLLDRERGPNSLSNLLSIVTLLIEMMPLLVDQVASNSYFSLALLGKTLRIDKRLFR